MPTPRATDATAPTEASSMLCPPAQQTKANASFIRPKPAADNTAIQQAARTRVMIRVLMRHN
ncbi:MAG: hypothetical protein DI546_01555 [Rhizobium sp.]|nr:MAG: hypothetical protein DI546_01555 [Rhizobium sp.]